MTYRLISISSRYEPRSERPECHRAFHAIIEEYVAKLQKRFAPEFTVRSFRKATTKFFSNKKSNGSAANRKREMKRLAKERVRLNKRQKAVTEMVRDSFKARREQALAQIRRKAISKQHSSNLVVNRTELGRSQSLLSR